MPAGGILISSEEKRPSLELTTECYLSLDSHRVALVSDISVFHILSILPKMTRSWHINSPKTDLKSFIKRQTRYKQSCLDQGNSAKSCGKAEDRVTLLYQLFQSIHLTWLDSEISLKLSVVHSVFPR